MDHFQDKVAIVTGGASGIGQALCEHLGRKGAVVVVADINRKGVEQVASAITEAGGRAFAACLDVTRAEDVQKLVDKRIAENGRLDYMFNNAGIAITGDVRDMNLDQWRRIIDVNLMGVVYGTTAAYSVMHGQGFGHIVNTASLAGLLPVPTETAYSATKFAVVGLSTSLRLEAEDLGVRVSVVCPGFIQTGIFDAATILKANLGDLMKKIPFKLMKSTDAARIILRGVVRNQAVITLPSYARPYWWLYRFFPSALVPHGRKMIRDFRKLRAES